MGDTLPPALIVCIRFLSAALQESEFRFRVPHVAARYICRWIVCGFDISKDSFALLGRIKLIHQ